MSVQGGSNFEFSLDRLFEISNGYAGHDCNDIIAINDCKVGSKRPKHLLGSSEGIAIGEPISAPFRILLIAKHLGSRDFEHPHRCGLSPAPSVWKATMNYGIIFQVVPTEVGHVRVDEPTNQSPK